MLGIEAQVGLAEAIDEGLPLGEVAVRVSPFGFDLAPLRQPAVKPIEPLASPAFQALLTAADESYDFVLFDSPPLSEAAALGLLVRLVDTALLVVRAGATSSLDMARAIAPLRQENVLGVVLNRAAR
jgi:Mrp family chromosome partitioning ATPase